MQSRSETISVCVVDYGPGRNLMMRYRDPLSGKHVARSTGTRDRREAERAAAVWQDELTTGRYAAPSRVTWQQFKERYLAEKASTLAPATQEAIHVAFGHLERVLNPDRLVKVTAAAMSRFAAELRKGTPRTEKRKEKGLRDATVARQLRHIKAALRWGARMGFLAKAPEIEMPRFKGQSLARSRAVTTEEFERMLAAVPKVRRRDAAAWQRFLRGLWLSGLRLREALALSWDQDAPFAVDLTGKRPVVRIFAEAQKARRDEILPLPPDAAALLLETPADRRQGQVFRLVNLATGQPIPAGEVGRAVSAIGRKAGVVTNKDDGKFAGCHDLRRAFASRWCRRVSPSVLKRLMRHRSIATTEAYYVQLDADELADELWADFGAAEGKTAAAGNTLGNTQWTGDDCEGPGNRRNPLPHKLAEAGVEPARGLPPTGF